MIVFCQRVVRAALFHDAETQTISKRPAPILVFEKELPCLMETIRIGPSCLAAISAKDAFK
jgi:hypothetical protein